MKKRNKTTNKTDKVVKIILEQLSDMRLEDIILEFDKCLFRLRLISEKEFDSLSQSEKIKILLEFNEDQLNQKLLNCLKQIKMIDFTKADLLAILEILRKIANTKREILFYSAIALSEELKSNINLKIKKIFGSVRVVFKVDLELMLGGKIDTGDGVIDFSLEKASLPIIKKIIKKNIYLN